MSEISSNKEGSDPMLNDLQKQVFHKAQITDFYWV